MCEKYMFGDKSTFGSEGMKHTLFTICTLFNLKKLKVGSNMQI